MLERSDSLFDERFKNPIEKRKVGSRTVGALFPWKNLKKRKALSAVLFQHCFGGGQDEHGPRGTLWLLWATDPCLPDLFLY